MMFKSNIRKTDWGIVNRKEFGRSLPGQRHRYSDCVRAGRSGVWIQVGARDFLFSITVRPGPGAHPASSTMGAVFLSLGVKRVGRDVTTHSPIAPRLRMGRTIDLLSFCFFMVWSVVTFAFFLPFERFGRSRSWFGRGNILAFAWRNYGQLKTKWKSGCCGRD